MKIIGIDPGLAATGIGLVSGAGFRIDGFSYGSIHTASESSLAKRLNCIFSKLITLIDHEKPELMVIEDIFSLHRYPKSGINLGQVSGVIQLAAARAKIEAIEIPVRETKKVLTGNGNASKCQLEKAVRDVLCLSAPIRPYHASDALALALIGLYRFG
jgi:crossover junction endodeoxyribonuclease RuvC